ncbi:MAG: hypothetical protein HOD92_08570 [Deltaproteobacteria bacterium]|jgi:hypothetical protein|nr:hypothetical protein [Deltaproteobacteria bacterium]
MSQLTRREFVRKLSIGAITAPWLIQSLTSELLAQPREVRQPLVWLKGQSSDIHEHSRWGIDGFSEFLNQYFQVIPSDIVEIDDYIIDLPNNAPSPILILEGYFTEDTESAKYMQLKEITASSRVAILLGNEAVNSASHPQGFLNLETRLLNYFEKPIIKLPGFSTPADYLLSVINYLVAYNRIPELDEFRRPIFLYSETICDRCEFRSDFENGNFVNYYGEKKGCLYQLGCKGLISKNNCPKLRFNNSDSWCVSVGSPCTGCSETGFYDHSGLGMFGALSSNHAAANSFLIRNSRTIAKTALGVAMIGIGVHAFSKKTTQTVEIQTEYLLEDDDEKYND